MAKPWRYWFEDLRAGRGSGLVLLILLGIQLGVDRAGGWEVQRRWVEALGLSRDGLLSGKFWQPLSYACFHGEWVHASINLLAWVMVGPRLERIGGWRLLATVAVGGVLGGAIGHLVFGGERILIGASGAILGMLLWLTGVSPESRMWPLPVSGRSLGWGMILASALLAIWDPEPLGGVSHGCHLGGALAGWLMARWTLRPRVTREKLLRERERREARESDPG